jgi:hypothetical protein
MRLARATGLSAAMALPRIPTDMGRVLCGQRPETYVRRKGAARQSILAGCRSDRRFALVYPPTISVANFQRAPAVAWFSTSVQR